MIRLLNKVANRNRQCTLKWFIDCGLVNVLRTLGAFKERLICLVVERTCWGARELRPVASRSEAHTTFGEAFSGSSSMSWLSSSCLECRLAPKDFAGTRPEDEITGLAKTVIIYSLFQICYIRSSPAALLIKELRCGGKHTQSLLL